MTIEILISFVDRNSLTGELTSYAQGDVVRNLSDEVANAFISAGLAKAYTNLGVAGNISITANGQYDVADYASATVNVPDFKNLVDKSITSVTADMLAGVTSIGDYAFYNCDSLTSVIIPSGVTSIGEHAFSSCGSLTSVEIPSTVASTGVNAFYLCSSLTSVEISSGVTSISSTSFYGCSSLENITIPSTVTSILDAAFMSCINLESVTVLATVPPTLGSDAFSGASSLVIYVPAESVDTYKEASGWSDYSGEIEAIPAEEAQS